MSMRQNFAKCIRTVHLREQIRYQNRKAPNLSSGSNYSNPHVRQQLRNSAFTFLKGCLHYNILKYQNQEQDVIEDTVQGIYLCSVLIFMVFNLNFLSMKMLLSHIYLA